MADLVRRTDRRVGEAIAVADARLADTVQEVRALRQSVEPLMAEAQGLLADTRQTQAAFVRRIDYWTDCEANGLCWQGAFTDMLLDARRAARSVAQAAPQTAQAVEATARSVALTAEASARTADNLATITKPGPKWVRWAGLGLSVAAPAAQVALPFAVGSLSKK